MVKATGFAAESGWTQNLNETNFEPFSKDKIPNEKNCEIPNVDDTGFK